MAAVTAGQNMDKPKMVIAVVAAGAKIFVEPGGDPGVAAAAAAMKQNNNARIRTIALRVADLCPHRIFVQEEPHRLPFVWRCGLRRTSLP
jgi:hypothetical protein